MKRFFYVSNSLRELGQVELELEGKGMAAPQIHVLSNDESEMAHQHLPAVADFMKTDVVHGGLIGLLIGAAGAVLVLGVAAVLGWTQAVGWVPFVFLAIVVLGFCTWEGGFFGFQERNHQLRKFERDLADNRHVLLVDIEPRQETLLRDVMSRHPTLKPAGVGDGAPAWVVSGQERIRHFMHWAP